MFCLPGVLQASGEELSVKVGETMYRFDRADLLRLSGGAQVHFSHYPGTDTWEIDIPDPEGQFEMIYKLFKGEGVQIASDNCYFLNAAAKEMQISSLVLETLRFINDGRVLVPFDEQSPLDGIIACLSPITSDSLEISASSSTYEGPTMELIRQDGRNTYWMSDPKPEECVKFDFKDKKVSLTDYTLKSAANSTDNLHPTSWIVAGSNDGEDWVIIDQVDDTLRLSNGDHCERFTVEPTEPFRYILIQMTEVNMAGNWVFRLSRVEFFGEISF